MLFFFRLRNPSSSSGGGGRLVEFMAIGRVRAGLLVGEMGDGADGRLTSEIPFLCCLR